MAAPFGKSVTKHGGPETFSQSEWKQEISRKSLRLLCVSFECDSLSAEVWMESQEGTGIAGSSNFRIESFCQGWFLELGQEGTCQDILPVLIYFAVVVA